MSVIIDILLTPEIDVRKKIILINYKDIYEGNYLMNINDHLNPMIRSRIIVKNEDDKKICPMKMNGGPSPMILQYINSRFMFM